MIIIIYIPLSILGYTLKLGMMFIKRNKEDVFDKQLLLNLTEVK